VFTYLEPHYFRDVFQGSMKTLFGEFYALIAVFFFYVRMLRHPLFTLSAPCALVSQDTCADIRP
jgi:hypothetical protein